jgi:type IX secretion system PorP/SprF family membrane protein
MKKNILNTLFFLLIASGFYKAQDFHISQYDAGSLYLNPALTGMYNGEKGSYKVYADSRAQWRALGVKPFFTTYLAYDAPYKIKDKNIGLGGYFINNRTGPGNFNTTEFMISGAYDILNRRADSKHYLTTGLQLGVFYKSFNTGKLTYDIQYSPTVEGGVFDQSVSSGETYSNLNILRFNANYGIFYKYIEKGERWHPFIGASLSHLNRANESFSGTTSRIPIKVSVNGGCDIKLDEKFDITPRFLYMNQAKSNEINFGILGYYKMSENNTRLMLGFDYRYKDAAIAHLGIKQENYFLRFSYDINTSYLNNYTRSRGAWEISLVYTGEKGKPFYKTTPKF